MALIHLVATRQEGAEDGILLRVLMQMDQDNLVGFRVLPKRFITITRELIGII
jgi:hypothetical protein